MSQRIVRLVGPIAFVALAFVALAFGAGASFAADPPGQLTKLMIVGQSNQREVPAGAPLRFKLEGTGRCSVEISIVESNRPQAAQTFDVNFAANQEYATQYILPPFGTAGKTPLEKDFTVFASPKGTCKGSMQAAMIHSVCKGTCSSSGTPSDRPTRLTVPVITSASSSPSTPSSASGGRELRLNIPLRTIPSGTVSSNTTPPAPTGTASAKPAKSTEVPPAPPSPPSIPGSKPATGNLTLIQVPGGSFAEDEAQKVLLKGTGGCGLDLHISNKSYGGSFDKTWNVNPVNLLNSPTLYNGTHFDTLAEGSYHADAIGKNGCTGTVQVDFKVTAKTTNASVKGQPTLTLDKQPKSGNTFSKSKDSNIWFKVAVPSSFKDTPYVSCCEVEYDYINQYGGWEVLPTSPFTDPGLNPLANNNQAAFRSVSYFTVPNEVATKWRMRVRGYKYKTAFEWSSWLEFQVDQN